MDKIQITEEQARDIFDKCVFSGCGTPLNIFLASLEDEGYLKQNPVDVAKEIYKNWRDREPCASKIDVINALYKAIEYLEAKK